MVGYQQIYRITRQKEITVQYTWQPQIFFRWRVMNDQLRCFMWRLLKLRNTCLLNFFVGAERCSYSVCVLLKCLDGPLIVVIGCFLVKRSTKSLGVRAKRRRGKKGKPGTVEFGVKDGCSQNRLPRVSNVERTQNQMANVIFDHCDISLDRNSINDVGDKDIREKNSSEHLNQKR